MPVNVPSNYPAGCSEEEILAVISGLSQEMITGGANINVVLRFSPLIIAGQSELQNRVLQANNLTTTNLHNEVTQLKKITKNYSKSSERFSNASRKISIVAVAIAILSLIISLALSIISTHSNNQWQNQQLRILNKIQINTLK